MANGTIYLLRPYRLGPHGKPSQGIKDAAAENNVGSGILRARGTTGTSSYWNSSSSFPTACWRSQAQPKGSSPAPSQPAVERHQRWGAGDWNHQDHFVKDLISTFAIKGLNRPIQNQGSRNKVLDTLTIPLATTGITLKNNCGASLLAQQQRITCQRKRHRFDPWSRKILHAAEQLSLCSSAGEATALRSPHAQPESSPCFLKLAKSPQSNTDPAKPKTNK